MYRNLSTPPAPNLPSFSSQPLTPPRKSAARYNELHNKSPALTTAKIQSILHNMKTGVSVIGGTIYRKPLRCV